MARRRVVGARGRRAGPAPGARGRARWGSDCRTHRRRRAGRSGLCRHSVVQHRRGTAARGGGQRTAGALGPAVGELGRSTAALALRNRRGQRTRAGQPCRDGDSVPGRRAGVASDPDDVRRGRHRNRRGAGGGRAGARRSGRRQGARGGGERCKRVAGGRAGLGEWHRSADPGAHGGPSGDRQREVLGFRRRDGVPHGAGGAVHDARDAAIRDLRGDGDAVRAGGRNRCGGNGFRGGTVRAGAYAVAGVGVHAGGRARRRAGPGHRTDRGRRDGGRVGGVGGGKCPCGSGLY